MDVYQTLMNELEQRLGRSLEEKEVQLVSWMAKAHVDEQKTYRDDRLRCDG